MSNQMVASSARMAMDSRPPFPARLKMGRWRLAGPKPPAAALMMWDVKSQASLAM
mgnify:CR=1 FL=1